MCFHRRQRSEDSHDRFIGTCCRLHHDRCRDRGWRGPSRRRCRRQPARPGPTGCPARGGVHPPFAAVRPRPTPSRGSCWTTGGPPPERLCRRRRGPHLSLRQGLALPAVLPHLESVGQGDDGRGGPAVSASSVLLVRRHGAVGRPAQGQFLRRDLQPGRQAGPPVAVPRPDRPRGLPAARSGSPPTRSKPA